ncbi:methylmalonyl Co-A mutase-associated GTPase MeaB [Nocardioides astragali]|uniref:Methylmalonyl Co-A mutase-associated GTPase MeaB n=1 Tax=Nocardioides astragali TaxID=1776736 RepID=A0ABW2N450_9ACTN|nr:methylmalonyl Co-A mutase-associated GTPase MeaB [Nocardioides astragali]
MARPARQVDVPALVEGVLAGRRADVSRAITLVESSRAEHRVAARELLTELAERARAASRPLATRVGISGVPGVGKSTFIESLGTRLTAAGHRVGVLAVDPSSVRTGGSVLGDKTRMAALAVDPRAFIRPSPSAGTLGGVARATTQAMLVLEAAGHDVVLVETVGVGQSEVTVAGMVDTFLFLTLARTGDQLQGIKKGILEIADVVAVNKADSSGGAEHEGEARVAARELAGALRLVRGHAEWAPPVVTCSGLTGVGVDDVWHRVEAHREHLGEDGLARKRAEQQLEFTWALVRDELAQRLRSSAGVAAVRDDVRRAVLAGELPAPLAADRLLAAYDGQPI